MIWTGYICDCDPIVLGIAHLEVANTTRLILMETYLIFKLLIMVISHKIFHANLKLKTPLKCYNFVSVKL